MGILERLARLWRSSAVDVAALEQRLADAEQAGSTAAHAAQVAAERAQRAAAQAVEAALVARGARGAAAAGGGQRGVGDGAGRGLDEDVETLDTH